MKKEKKTYEEPERMNILVNRVQLLLKERFLCSEKRKPLTFFESVDKYYLKTSSVPPRAWCRCESSLSRGGHGREQLLQQNTRGFL